jgi:DNA-binding transcriptional MocR family regulator
LEHPGSDDGDAWLRQTLARDVLSELKPVGHRSSYFLWLPLPEDVRADLVATALAAKHVSVSTAEPFATSSHVPHAIRLALGSTDPDTLRQALLEVKRVIDARTHL